MKKAIFNFTLGLLNSIAWGFLIWTFDKWFFDIGLSFVQALAAMLVITSLVAIKPPDDLDPFPKALFIVIYTASVIGIGWLLSML